MHFEFDAEFWVAVAFVIFIAVLIKLGAFRVLIDALDDRGARIKAELDEARRVRAEAQALLADEKISLESIMQRHHGGLPHGGDDPKSPDAPAPVILITYATSEDAVRRALKAIRKKGVIAGTPQVIRIEKN